MTPGFDVSSPRKSVRVVNPWADLAATIITGVPRLPGALCRGRPGLFDGGDDESVSQAAAICRRCPELAACSRWVRTLPDNTVHGVVAGRLFTYAGHESLRKHPNGQPVTPIVATASPAGPLSDPETAAVW